MAYFWYAPSIPEARIKRLRAAYPEAMISSLHLEGDTLPVPPQQTAKWTPPQTNLSNEFIDATATLFQQGLADPRGCEYREIEVLTYAFVDRVAGWAWEDKVTKTHGWVIPNADTRAQRFAICWNGLVYPLAAIGKPADLRFDVSQVEKDNVEGLRWWQVDADYECVAGPDEERSECFHSPFPIKACLLLRLGEAELAERVWNRWTSGLRSSSIETGMHKVVEGVEPYRAILKDPYLVLANLWTLSLLDRAEAAHMRSDDRLALAATEKLHGASASVKDEAEKRGFKEPSPEEKPASSEGEFSPAEEEPTPYFLIEPHRIQALLADQRRRAENRRNGARPPMLNDREDWEQLYNDVTKNAGQFADKKRRIALLIDEFEEVSWQVYGGQPAHGPSEFDILLILLIREGEDAVEPLLTCLESDNRLSRFRMYRDSPLGVYKFAEVALPVILKTPFHDPDELEPDRGEAKHRTVIAARIRAYWERSKNLPPAERWYGVLADDQAEPYQWLAAAGDIVGPTRWNTSSGFVGPKYSRFMNPTEEGRDWWRTDAKREMQGEALRDKSNPSVAELMARRIKTLNQPYSELLSKRKKLDKEIENLDAKLKRLDLEMEKLSNGPERAYDAASLRLEKLQEKRYELEQKREELDWQIWDDEADWRAPFEFGCDIAFCLAQWDSAAAVDVLREQTELCRQALPEYEASGVGMFGSRSNFKLLEDGYLFRLLTVLAELGDQQAADELRTSAAVNTAEK